MINTEKLRPIPYRITTMKKWFVGLFLAAQLVGCGAESDQENTPPRQYTKQELYPDRHYVTENNWYEMVDSEKNHFTDGKERSQIQPFPKYYIYRAKEWPREDLNDASSYDLPRVQFYWAAAGLLGENNSKFSHESFLQSQDAELGWIRNVMRVALLRVNAENTKRKEALDFAIREWVGGDPDYPEVGGQLAYFQKRTKEKRDRLAMTERLSLFTLVISAAIVLIIIIFGNLIPDEVGNLFISIMATFLLLVGIREGYGYNTAEKELVKQYEFMLRIMQSARARLDQMTRNKDRRQLLKSLGGLAMNEHAEWILFHRDRNVDENDIFFMGS